ncbi:hypothetical protein M404DRAFT_135294, partial [Pisolithus tinctorius Marx 270]
PWHKLSDLLDGYSCWTEAFDTHPFCESMSRMISNFLIELECLDARDVERDNYASKKRHPTANPGFCEQNTGEMGVELLREALILDSDLDQAVWFGSPPSIAEESNEYRKAALPQDELDIITMSRSLHRGEMQGPSSCAAEGRVMEVSVDLEDQITLHNTYMNAQRKRKHPERPSLGDNVSDEEGSMSVSRKRPRTSGEGEARTITVDTVQDE